MAEKIIFDPEHGFSYAGFSFKRWFWGKVLSLALWLSCRGDDLWSLSFERSGEDILMALNDDIPDEYQSARQRDVVDNWDRHVTLLLKDKEASHGA